MNKRPLVLVAIGLVLIAVQWWNLHGSFEAETPLDYLRDALFSRTDAGKSAGPQKKTISRSQATWMVRDLSMVKIAVAEYLNMNEALPHKVADLDVGEQFPKNFRLLGNGALEVLVDGKPNARVYWRLIPRPGSSSTSFATWTWECVSPDIANVSERVKDCLYNPSFKKDEPTRMDYKTEHWLLFAFDRADEKGMTQGNRDGFQRFLRDVAPLPTRQMLSVQLTGYADPMGDAKHNIRLAEARAAYVRETLAATGIDRSLINTRVIGATHPGRACHNMPRKERIYCFEPSRRVDVVVTVRKDM